MDFKFYLAGKVQIKAGACIGENIMLSRESLTLRNVTGVGLGSENKGLVAFGDTKRV